MNSPLAVVCHCPCGNVSFDITAPPVFRAFCHCTLCQQFNAAAYADVVVFRASSITLEDESGIDFKVYKQPPVVYRGSCRQCSKPAVEKIAVPLMPRLIVVPAENITEPALLPESACHIFYDRRVADVDDGIRKYKGFVPSQFAFGSRLVKGLVFGS